MLPQKIQKDATEVSVNYMLNDAGQETGVVVLEVVSPVYGPYSSSYNSLMERMQEARRLVFGYKTVIDLLNVPLEVGAKMDPAGNVNVFTVYEKANHRNRYMFVGTPKPEFDRRMLDKGGQLLLKAG